MNDIEEETLRAARLFLARIGRRYDIASACLFGSRARRSHHNESDIDIAVVLRGAPGPRVRVKLDMADDAYDVLLETGLRVQPLPIWEREWRQTQEFPNPRLLQEIAREGVAL